MKSSSKLMISTLLLSAPAFAVSPYIPPSPCAGLRIEGKYQILPLDGSKAFLGSSTAMEEKLGGPMNTPVIEKGENGVYQIAYYEETVPAHLGRSLGSAGNFTLDEQRCLLQLDSAQLGHGSFKIAMRSERGDLVLAKYGEKTPVLVFKKLN